MNSNIGFTTWWATMIERGYQYGPDALEQVAMGFEGAQECALSRIAASLETMCSTMLANQAKMEAEIAEQKAMAAERGR